MLDTGGYDSDFLAQDLRYLPKRPAIGYDARMWGLS
jgi:hypothetical protein